MRHQNMGRQLSRSSSHRLALMKNLLSSLLMHGRITTTVAKAKELRRYADQFITLGKKGDLAARRDAFTWVRNPALLSKLFSEYATHFKDRQGGYTRILRVGPRLGDAAEMAMIEYVDFKPAVVAKPTKADKKASKAAKPAKEAKAPKAEKVAKAAKPAKAAKSAGKSATKKKASKATEK